MNSNKTTSTVPITAKMDRAVNPTLCSNFVHFRPSMKKLVTPAVIAVITTAAIADRIQLTCQRMPSQRALGWEPHTWLKNVSKSDETDFEVFSFLTYFDRESSTRPKDAKISDADTLDIRASNIVREREDEVIFHARQDTVTATLLNSIAGLSGGHMFR